MEDNARTIRPNRSPGNQPVPLAQPPASDIQPIVEDYSDLGTEEDEVRLQEKVADFRVRYTIVSIPFIVDLLTFRSKTCR